MKDNLKKQFEDYISLRAEGKHKEYIEKYSLPAPPELVNNTVIQTKVALYQNELLGCTADFNLTKIKKISPIEFVGDIHAAIIIYEYPSTEHFKEGITTDSKAAISYDMGSSWYFLPSMILRECVTLIYPTLLAKFEFQETKFVPLKDMKDNMLTAAWAQTPAQA